MTVVIEPAPTLMTVPIEQLIELAGSAHDDLKDLSYALKHRMDEARQVMTMTEIASRTGYSRTTIHNWHNNSK